MFYYKTTLYVKVSANFVSNDILTIFVMEKDFVKRVSVWEKVSDFMMDISKYVLTAVIITSAFEELSETGWMMYLVGISGSILLLIVSVIIIHILNKRR